MLDRNAEALGVSVADLMENAGAAVAERVAALAGPEGVVVLAGPGNNGGDGLVAARLLAERYQVRVLLPFEDGGWKSSLARAAFERLPKGIAVSFAPPLEEVRRVLAEPGVVVDALLGAGLTGELREPYHSWVEALGERAGRVVSVDVPTGLGTGATFVPSETVTFHDVKEGMTERNSGRIHVADIGIPADAARFTGPGEYALYPEGREDQHKGEGGIVLIIGGGPYTGAPAVAGMAALRAGADLAIILTPKRAWPIVASYSPNLVVRPLVGDDLDFEDPSNRVTLNAWLRKAHSVVVGPGVGLFDQAQRAVHHVLERAAKEDVPVVIDADALTALSQKMGLVTPRTVLAPHAKEFESLTGKPLPKALDARAETVRLAAGEHGGAWLVKGPTDVIAEGTRLKLNATGSPAMSVGGTGDALAGTVGALLAKGMSPFDAARLGARLVGEAGARAAEEKGWGLVATDVVEAIPAVLVHALTKRRPLKRDIQ